MAKLIVAFRNFASAPKRKSFEVVNGFEEEWFFSVGRK
jgi:hypothetical protein